MANTRSKKDFLRDTIQHIDIKAHDVRPLVTSMKSMAFQARNLARAADIYDQMLQEPDCAIILCLAGSLISAGLKGVVVDLVRSHMVDCIVSTGANIVDQDFFEGLGFKHYLGHARRSTTTSCATCTSTASTTPSSTRTTCASAT